MHAMHSNAPPLVPAHSRHCCGSSVCPNFRPLFRNFLEKFDNKEVIPDDAEGFLPHRTIRERPCSSDNASRPRRQ
ncbi:MAG TPA: hypothetical protein VFK51_14115 [Burkholderiales bacterium]|jgi:hypothetical protein|nr:hypothetical protein [Burkholderiales bacterium]